MEFGVLIERAAYLCTVETHRLLTAAEQEEARHIREIYSESLAELGGAEREALEAAVRQYELPETDTSPCEPRPDELDILLEREAYLGTEQRSRMLTTAEDSDPRLAPSTLTERFSIDEAGESIAQIAQIAQDVKKTLDSEFRKLTSATDEEEEKINTAECAAEPDKYDEVADPLPDQSHGQTHSQLVQHYTAYYHGWKAQLIEAQTNLASLPPSYPSDSHNNEKRTEWEAKQKWAQYYVAWCANLAHSHLLMSKGEGEPYTRQPEIPPPPPLAAKPKAKPELQRSYWPPGQSPA